MPPRRIVLASTSSGRRMLMERLLPRFDVIDPQLDEAPFKTRGLAPDALVAQLAIAKAEAVRSRANDALVVGSDQVVRLDDAIFGKPGGADEAVAQLRRLRGRTHELLTAVAVLDGATGRVESAIDRHRLTMLDLPDDALAAYVAADRPEGCAGSYRIESLGPALFDAIEGGDGSAIVGLPLLLLARLLRRFGFDPLLDR